MNRLPVYILHILSVSVVTMNNNELDNNCLHEIFYTFNLLKSYILNKNWCVWMCFATDWTNDESHSVCVDLCFFIACSFIQFIHTSAEHQCLN